MVFWWRYIGLLRTMDERIYSASSLRGHEVVSLFGPRSEYEETAVLFAI